MLRTLLRHRSILRPRRLLTQLLKSGACNRHPLQEEEGEEEGEILKEIEEVITAIRSGLVKLACLIKEVQQCPVSKAELLTLILRPA